MKLNIKKYSLSEIETILKILFGEDWKNANIEKRDYPFRKEKIFDTKWEIGLDFCRNIYIYNNNGLIYKDGIFATRKLGELPEKYVRKGNYIFFSEPFKFNTIYRKSEKETVENFHNNIIYCEGYQYLTDWQLEELQNKPKVGDFGVFYGNVDGNGKMFAELKRIYKDSSHKYSTGKTIWENFDPVKDEDHIKIIKSYLKWEK